MEGKLKGGGIGAAVVAIALLALIASPAAAFTFMGPKTKWDTGINTASVHGFTAPDGPRIPGAATWSVMGAGFDLDAGAPAALDPDHGANLTKVMTDLGVPGFATVAAYEAVFKSALDTWAGVSGFSNLGKVADGAVDAGAPDGGGGELGDIRFAAWELTDDDPLAHAYAPGTEAVFGAGGTIQGDVHIDKGRTWINVANHMAGDGKHDLHTVVLHELGHSLGLGHSTVPSSVMVPKYSGGRRVLQADDKEGIQALYGGPATAGFSVDGGFANPFRPAGTANPAEGIDVAGAGPFPNDVYVVGTAPGGYGFNTEAEIFTSPMDGTNTLTTGSALGPALVGPNTKGVPGAPAPPGMLGLVPTDNMNALSNGTNGTGGLGAVLKFSVDPAAIGGIGSEVEFEALLSPAGPAAVAPFPDNPGGGDPGAQAAGDIFASTVLPKTFGAYPGIATATVAHAGDNRLFADDGVLGLQAPAANGSAGVGTAEDDLDALELDGTENIFFSIDPFSPSVSPALTTYDGGPIANYYPVPIHMIGETITPDDILRGPAAALGIYAGGVKHIGLVPGDDLDALVLSDQTDDQFGGVIMTPNGILDPVIDTALFSLAPGSPSAGAFGPGAVFWTDFTGSFSLFATAAELGLTPGDNLNALDVRIGNLPPPLGGILIPEPAGLGLVGVVLLALRRRRQ